MQPFAAAITPADASCRVVIVVSDTTAQALSPTAASADAPLPSVSMVQFSSTRLPPLCATSAALTPSIADALSAVPPVLVMVQFLSTTLPPFFTTSTLWSASSAHSVCPSSVRLSPSTTVTARSTALFSAVAAAWACGSFFATAPQEERAAAATVQAHSAASLLQAPFVIMPSPPFRFVS